MGSADLSAPRSRARRAYELGRLRRALLGAAPLAAVAGLAACVAARPSSTLAFGAAALAAAVGMLWYGRDPQRALLPGAASGLIPLTLALCANRVHVCGPDGCTSLCLPACALGGVLAGVLVARVGHRRGAGPAFWLSGSAIALLVGAMGCACVGYSGLVGLALGFAAGAVPALVRRTAS